MSSEIGYHLLGCNVSKDSPINRELHPMPTRECLEVITTRAIHVAIQDYLLENTQVL